MEENNSMSPADKDKRNTLKIDLAHRLQIEATTWKQKCNTQQVIIE